MFQATTLLSFAALALAAPTELLRKTDSGSVLGYKPTTTQYESTFDDLDPVAGGLISLQQVGPYNGLDYQGINLITLGLNGEVLTGVTPKSAPNVGAYSARSQLLDGGASPLITTNYPGSVTDTFDFQRFYFGCVAATAEAIASTPLSCTIKVQGYRASNEVAKQEFEFNAGLLQLRADMVEARLNEHFRGVDTVTFTTEYAVPGAGATLLDSLRYKTYNAVASKGGKGKAGGKSS